MKEKRQELGLSRQDASEICNMHEGYVKQIETGSKLPALPLLLKICETLHTSPNYLFEFSEDKDVQDVLELLYTLTPEQLKAVKHMISSYLEFKENMEEQNERLKRGISNKWMSPFCFTYQQSKLWSICLSS